jgi:hypothetical protein
MKGDPRPAAWPASLLIASFSVALVSGCSASTGDEQSGPCANFSADPIVKAIGDVSGVLQVVESTLSDGVHRECVYYGKYGDDPIIGFTVTEGAKNAASVDAHKMEADACSFERFPVGDDAYRVLPCSGRLYGLTYFIQKGSSELKIEVTQKGGHNFADLDKAAIAIGQQL